MSMEELFRDHYQRRIRKFLAENTGLKLDEKTLMKFCQECYDDFFDTQLYIDKVPHWTSPKKEDLKIMIPRTMNHLFEGWVCRILRLRKSNELYESDK